MRRDLDLSIPAVTCVAPVTCGPGAIITGVTRSRPERHTEEGILTNQTDLTANFVTYGFKHTLASGIDLSLQRFDQLRYASAGPSTTLNDPNNSQSPNSNIISVKADTNATDFGILPRTRSA